MTKGFKDSNGKFRPTGNSSNGVSSDDMSDDKLINKLKEKMEKDPEFKKSLQKSLHSSQIMGYTGYDPTGAENYEIDTTISGIAPVNTHGDFIIYGNKKHSWQVKLKSGEIVDVPLPKKLLNQILLGREKGIMYHDGELEWFWDSVDELKKPFSLDDIVDMTMIDGKIQSD